MSNFVKIDGMRACGTISVRRNNINIVAQGGKLFRKEHKPTAQISVIICKKYIHITSF